jgi:tRNA-Thr(GGU) m(6)t(6)A37 methyltransferase TsaA
MKYNNIIYKAIGVIYTPFNKIKDMPLQPIGADKVKGTVEIKKKFIPGLKDLDGFSHIILIYHFSASKGFSLEVTPFLDKIPRGLFATRAPKRPNQIGLSVVRLIKIEQNKLFIENVDILNGTPLLDIKPYVKEFDHPAKSKSGWLTDSAHLSKKIKSDGRFQ